MSRTAHTLRERTLHGVRYVYAAGCWYARTELGTFPVETAETLVELERGA